MERTLSCKRLASILSPEMELQEAKPPCMIANPKQFQPETISSLSQRSEQIIYTPPANAFPRFANAHSKSAGDATPLSVRLVQTQRVDEGGIDKSCFLQVRGSRNSTPLRAFATRIQYVKTTTYTKHLPRLQRVVH